MSWWSAVTWDIARAGGVTAYVLLTLSVVLGLALSMRWQRPRWPRLITNELHSFLTLLSLVFLTVHIAAVWIDPFTRFGWRDIFVPLASTYRPLWMGLGIVGLYLLLAVWISSRLRSRIAYAWWRRLHTLTFGVYILATVHGIGTGSDTRTAWALAIYAGGVLLVAALTAWRLLTPIGVRGRTHPRLAALTAGALCVTAFWTVAGPARAGWNSLANTTLGGHTTTAVPAAAAKSAARVLRVLKAFNADLQGTATQSGPDATGNVELSFTTNLNDGTGRSLNVIVQGQAQAEVGGQISVTGTRVTLIGSSGQPLYQGQLSQLQGGGPAWQMAADLSVSGPDATSGRLHVTISMQTDQNGQLSGTLAGTPAGLSSNSASGTHSI